MELPQSKPFGIQGKGRKTTHDFLSLYTAAHQDQRSTQGELVQTHDFLQPLEQVRKNGIRQEEGEEDIIDNKEYVGKPLRSVVVPPHTQTQTQPQPLLPRVVVGPASLPSTAEHVILPGGNIGSYSITNMMMSHANNSNSHSCKNDENSNSSSYTNGNVFTIWDDSGAVNMGKTRKENNACNKSALREGGMNQGGGQWTMTMDNSTSSNPNNHNNTTTYTSPSSPRPSSTNRINNHTFMDMITSTKNNHQEEDDEEDDEEFNIKSEPSSYSKGNLSVKVDGKSTSQKPNTPRSKHSATEQRRRSKINDRFQKLREVIPHGDQKRDKASFLLEVIEYIQHLQEKVHKYDSTYQGWSHEPPKILPRINQRNSGPDFMTVNAGSCLPVLLGTKYDETKADKSAGLLLNGQPIVDLDMRNATNLREKIYQTEPESAVQQLHRFSSSTITTQDEPNTRIGPGSNGAIEDKVKNRELCIESGAINISSRYSQGLLNNLTQALESSGVDLSQASISVQIDLGKRTNADLNISTSIMKDNEISKKNQEIPTTSSIKNKVDDESIQAVKRLKTSKS